jgi:hypothetical protein
MSLIRGDGVNQRQPAKIGELKRRVGARPSRLASRSARSRLGSELKRTGYDVAEPSFEDWERQDQKIIADYCTQTEREFFAIIDEYVADADEVTRKYKACEKSHARWGLSIIIATGILALINLCAALNWTDQCVVSQFLNAFAGGFAICLTAARHAENSFNWGEKANGFREARELLLNRYQEYRSKWICFVVAYGETPIACMNAGRLYRQLVDSDQDLRQNLKQLTTVKRTGQADKSAAGH